MAKILRFENTAELQLQLADKYLSEGKIPSAVQALKCAIKNGADKSAHIQLGEVYLRAGLVGQAFDTYASAYASGDDSVPCLFGLCRSAFFMGYDVESADYFKQIFIKNLSEITKNTTNNYDIEEMNEEFSAITSMLPDNHGFTFVKNNECKEFSSEAMDMLREAPEKALPYFESISPKSPLYYEARNNVALINLMMGATSEAKAECKKVLQHNPNDVFALSTLLACYSADDDEQGVKRIVDRIEKLKLSNEEQIRKVALAMCQSCIHDKAVKYLTMLEDHKYEKNIMVLLAIAYYNVGKADKSLETLKNLYKLYPKERVMVTDLIKRVKDGQDKLLEYSVNMPYNVMLNKINLCRKWFGADYDDVCFDVTGLKDIVQSDSNYELLYWYLVNHAHLYKNDEIVLLFRLCQTGDERAISLLTDVLMDTDAPDYLKCKCMRVLLSGGWSRETFMVIGAKIVSTTPIYPKSWDIATERANEIDLIWTEAYSIAFTELFMRYSEYESELASLADVVYNNIKDLDPQSLRTPFAIAAVMYKRVKQSQGVKDSVIRDIFAVSPKTMIKYEKLCYKEDNDETN